jgi:preprotein translocase subunit YajC
MDQLLFPVILFGLMYLLLVRPQQQRLRKQRALLSTLSVGDRVVTVGGIIGTLTSIDGEEAQLEVSPGTVVTILRPAVSRRMDPAQPPLDAAEEGDS